MQQPLSFLFKKIWLIKISQLQILDVS